MQACRNQDRKGCTNNLVVLAYQDDAPLEQVVSLDVPVN